MKTLSFAAFALGTFLLGFFLLFGKGAAVSGSWKYVLRTSDDSFYWASAQASAEIPSSAGNPYYYEERGKKHTIPYPTVSFFGALSAWLGFPVLAFFPLWHVGMPFLVWLTLFLCLHRIWKYPEGPSAALALFFLLSTLYLRDVSHYALLRFSRPGDSLWLLFIWVSGTLNWTASWRHTVWLCLLGAASFWMNPFLAAMGVAVTAIETARSLPSRHWPSLRQHLFSLGAVFAAAVLYFLFIKWNSPGGASSVHVLETDYTLGGPKAEPSSLVLFLLAAALIACRRWFFRDAWTALDRLLLALTGLIAVYGNAGLLVPGNWQLVYHRYNYFAELAYHRYAFMTFEIAVLAGWFHQTLPQFRERPWFQKIEKPLAAALALSVLGVLMNADISFLRFAPNAGEARFLVGHPLLVLELIPVIYLAAWTFHAFSSWRKLAAMPAVAGALLAAVAFFGYSGMASQSYSTRTHLYRFQDQPFTGAYQWLSQNARPGDVVLTVPPSRLDIDYLIHYTPLKSFIHPFGEKLTGPGSKNDNTFRFLFYYHLLMGNLDAMDFTGLRTTEEKLSHLKLDYILIEMPSPFFSNIRAQLEKFAQPAYLDKRCLLLSVKPKVSAA